MALVTLKAGQTFETVTPQELSEALARERNLHRDLLDSYFRWPLAKHIPNSGTASTGGTLALLIGQPEPGFRWHVMAVVVSGPNPATQIQGNCNIHRSTNIAPSTLMDSTLKGNSSTTLNIPNTSAWTRNEFVLEPEEPVVANFFGTTASQVLWAVAHVFEVPISQRSFGVFGG